MNVRIWKWTGLVVLIAAMVCAMSYADRHEAKDVELPAAVKDAALGVYPQGTIDETKTEEQEFKIYAVKMKQNNQESELKITQDGAVIAVETKVGKETLPDTVAKALSKAAEGTEIKDVEKKVTYAVIKPVKLEAPETTYEADIFKDGNKCEIKLAANGNILEKSAWQGTEGKGEDRRNCDKDEDKDRDDENKDEQKVSIDQVPAAVKATILKEAGNGAIKEIEQETEDGKTTYEAEVITNDKKFEFKVSSDGKLLDKQDEEEDD